MTDAPIEGLVDYGDLDLLKGKVVMEAFWLGWEGDLERLDVLSGAAEYVIAQREAVRRRLASKPRNRRRLFGGSDASRGRACA
jgi:hypothetical protein